MRQLAATPGSALRRELLGDEAEWGPHEENTARLFEVQAYKLDWEWAQNTADEHEVRREQAEARRNGLKPPRRPFIPPIAERPAGIAERRLEEYLRQVAEHSAPYRPVATLDEFDKVISQM